MLKKVSVLQPFETSNLGLGHPDQKRFLEPLEPVNLKPKKISKFDTDNTQK